jgi:RNA polymerase sigma-70 factor (sigma-E family)
MKSCQPDFEKFVSQSTEGLLRTAYLIVFDLQEAEDLVQEALLKVSRRWPRVRRMQHPVAYARQILVNLALKASVRRARARDELSFPTAPEAAGEIDDASLVDTRDELLLAVAGLPPRQRTVLVLRYFLDLSEAEAAAAMQCSLGTVKSTASRALGRLEETLRTNNDPRTVPS